MQSPDCIILKNKATSWASCARYKFLSQHLSLFCDGSLLSHWMWPPHPDSGLLVFVEWLNTSSPMDKLPQLVYFVTQAVGMEKSYVDRMLQWAQLAPARPLPSYLPPLFTSWPSKACIAARAASCPPFYKLSTISLINRTHLLPFLYSLLRSLTLVKSWGSSDAANLFGNIVQLALGFFISGWEGTSGKKKWQEKHTHKLLKLTI